MVRPVLDYAPQRRARRLPEPRKLHLGGDLLSMLGLNVAVTAIYGIGLLFSPWLLRFLLSYASYPIAIWQVWFFALHGAARAWDPERPFTALESALLFLIQCSGPAATAGLGLWAHSAFGDWCC